ncbi:MAG: hypothetical protein OJF49_004039 [Ktedonobacterales bacterium]|nr:MAG: hypothetical protein OJF49_004039 [Ktedonobacterales bacterium]
MTRSPAPVAPSIARRRKTAIPPSFMLALWRLRKTWRLLIIAGLGNIAAVMLICVVPLFTQVALSAGLHGVLTEQPQNSRIIAMTNQSNVSRQSVDTINTQLQQVIAKDMGPYITGGAMFNVVMPYFELAQQGGSTNTGGPPDAFSITGYDFASLGDQISVLQGRLPAASATDFEIALTQQDAASLHAQVGSFVSVLLPGPQQPTPIQLRIVGIVLLKGAVLASGPQFFDGGYAGPQHFYQAVTSNDALLAALNNPATGGASNGVNGPQPQLSWAYQLDTSRITTATLGDVVSRLGKLQTDVPGQLNEATNGQGIFVEPFALNALQGFMVKLILLQIPILLLLVQVIALILLFVRMMAEMLVDYQADAISTLRSRGATRGQVFGAFTVQNIGLSLLALIVGPLAAIPLVAFLASHTLTAGAESVANALAGNPLAIAWGLRWYVLVAVLVSGLAMVLSTNRAAGRNILTLRRESARATSKPFWQRLNLDLIFGILSLLGYVGYTFAESQVSAQVQLILSPLAILAALLLLVAAVLLFLRLLPLLLGLGSRLSRRGRGAATVLTLTQMSRAPRQPIRMTLLLALSTGFTIFTLILNASQAQRLSDIAAYRVGADFSGTFSPAATATFASLKAQYAGISGVTSVTLGLSAEITPDKNSAGIDLKLLAVDADTFSTTAAWTDQDSSQPLADLLALLRAQRATAVSQNGVAAIVDDATWNAFHLTTGAPFTLTPPGDSSQTMRLIAVAHVRHIPTVYNVSGGAGGGFDGQGGILVDYASFAALYQHNAGSAAPLPTTVWLRSADDAASIASVRHALSSGDLALTNLLDRRQIVDSMRSDPLQLDIVNTLLIGAVTAMFLALAGIWAGSWFNARSRLVNFAVLRALGTTPRQLRVMLVQEQVIVYIAAIALGTGLGFVLALTSLPLLLFNQLVAQGGGSLTEAVTPPARIVVPGGTLLLALAVVVVICLLAIAITMAALTRLSLGQTLRLNED